MSDREYDFFNAVLQDDDAVDLVEMNDGWNMSFEQIADWIEQHVPAE